MYQHAKFQGHIVHTPEVPPHSCWYYWQEVKIQGDWVAVKIMIISSLVKMCQFVQRALEETDTWA